MKYKTSWRYTYQISYQQAKALITVIPKDNQHQARDIAGKKMNIKYYSKVQAALDNCLIQKIDLIEFKVQNMMNSMKELTTTVLTLIGGIPSNLKFQKQQNPFLSIDITQIVGVYYGRPDDIRIDRGYTGENIPKWSFPRCFNLYISADAEHQRDIVVVKVYINGLLHLRADQITAIEFVRN